MFIMKVFILLISLSVFSISDKSYEEKLNILLKIDALNKKFDSQLISKDEYKKELKLLINSYDKKLNISLSK